MVQSLIRTDVPGEQVAGDTEAAAAQAGELRFSGAAFFSSCCNSSALGCGPFGDNLSATHTPPHLL